jgi:hypothetical protein
VVVLEPSNTNILGVNAGTGTNRYAAKHILLPLPH